MSRATSTVLAVLCVVGEAAWLTAFRDDFTGPTLNASSWNTANDFTHGDQEWQLYLADECYIQGGALVLRTRSRDAVHGSRTYHFTSCWVDTRGKVELSYGKYEARIKLPAPQATVWPAYWLVDDNVHCWPVGGEVRTHRL